MNKYLDSKDKKELYDYCIKENILQDIIEYLRRVYDMDPTTCEISYLKIAIKNILYSK